MFKIISTLLAVLTMGIAAVAQGPNTILSQLGARGVTDHGGNTNYSAYLVKLNSAGYVDASMLPSSSSNLNSTRLNNLYFVDLNGTNVGNAGTIVLPYKTLSYALTNIVGNSVIVLGPGTHARAATPVANTSINHLVIMGYDSDMTRIDGGGLWSLAFQNNNAVTVTVMGVHIDRIDQKNNLPLTVNAYNKSRIDSISMDYALTNSFLTIGCSPDSIVPYVPTNAANILLHESAKIAYYPANPTAWDPAVTNVQDALDNLSTYPKLNPSTNAGSLLYWDGSQWNANLYGTSNQLLFGGTNPVFGMLNLGGAVTGPYTNVGLSVNIITTTNISNSAVTSEKLSVALQTLLSSVLASNSIFTGDVYGVYNSNVVIAIHGKAISAPASSNDNSVLVYDHAAGRFTYKTYADANVISNWATYPAIQSVNFGNHELTNVTAITLNGVKITTWPGASYWSTYPAVQNINIAGYGFANVGALQLGGVTRTNWPDADVTKWSTYPATTNLNIGGLQITNLTGISLNGQLILAWPVSASNWSLFAATSNLNMDGKDIYGASKFRFADWHISQDGGSLVFSNSDTNYSSVFSLTAEGRMKQPIGATNNSVMVSDVTGTGSWTNRLTIFDLNVVNTATVTELTIPTGASNGYMWTATGNDGKGYWAPYATVVVTNESDPIYLAGIINYYTKIDSDSRYLPIEAVLLFTNYYTKAEILVPVDEPMVYPPWANINHTHWNYAGIYHNHDNWYSQINHLHTGTYSPTNHTHDSYIMGKMYNNTNYSLVQYGYTLHYINSTSTYWAPDTGGGTGTVSSTTNRFDSIAVGPAYMDRPQIVSIFSATNAAVSIASMRTSPGYIETVTNYPGTGESINPTNPALTPEYALTPNYQYANIANCSGVRVKNFGFTIPQNSYVIGLVAEIKYRISGSPATAAVRINNNGYISPITNSFTMATGVYNTVTVGATNSTWGLNSIPYGTNWATGYLDGYKVDQTDFGVEIYTTAGIPNSYLIDSVHLTVYYTDSSSSYELVSRPDGLFAIKNATGTDVLQATDTRLRVPYGPYAGWVLTCIDTNGTAQWMPTSYSTNETGQKMIMGTSISTGLVNTTILSESFTNIPAIVSAFSDPALDEFAQVEVTSRATNSFTWRIRNGTGVINTNLTISWVAGNGVLASQGAGLWSTYPATCDVDVGGYGLNNVSSFNFGGVTVYVTNLTGVVPFWSRYPASTNVDIAGFNMSGINSMAAETVTVGGISNNGSWYAITTNAEWISRDSFGSEVLSNTMYVWGGYRTAPSEFLKDAWKSTNGGVTWTACTTNTAPQLASFGSTVFSNQLWMVGGWDGVTRMGTVYKSSDGSNWIQTAASFGEAEDGLQVVVFSNQLWMLGGHRAAGYDNTVRKSGDGITWNTIGAAGYTPREEYMAAVHNGKLWVAGGSALSVGYTNDVWYSDNGVSWTCATRTAPWSKRFGSVMCSKDNKLWITSGQKSAGWENDMWVTKDGINWLQVADSAPWTERGYAGSIVYNGTVIILGGAGSTFYNDVWGINTDSAWTLRIDANKNLAVSKSYFNTIVDKLTVGDSAVTVNTPILQLTPQTNVPTATLGGIYFGTNGVFYKCTNGTTWVAF